LVLHFFGGLNSVNLEPPTWVAVGNCCVPWSVPWDWDDDSSMWGSVK